MWAAWCERGGYSSAICFFRCQRVALGCGPAAMGEPLGEEQMPLWLLAILLRVNDRQSPNPPAEGIEVNECAHNYRGGRAANQASPCLPRPDVEERAAASPCGLKLRLLRQGGKCGH